MFYLAFRCNQDEFAMLAKKQNALITVVWASIMTVAQRIFKHIPQVDADHKNL